MTRCAGKTATTRYDVAEHLRTPEEMVAYLEAGLEDSDGDASFIAKALEDIAAPRVWHSCAGRRFVSREPDHRPEKEEHK